MPAPLGPLVGFALGALLAWLGRRPGEASLWPISARRSGVIALFAALVFAPICAYFLVFAADWSLVYVVDSRSVPSAFALVLVVADAASVFVGAEITRRLIQRGAQTTAAALVAAVLAPTALFILLFRTRLSVEGTFHQVQNDFGTQAVVSGPLGYALLWMALLLAAGLALTARTLSAERRPPPPPTTPGVDAPSSVFHS